jgi:RNA polymerase sigma-70 factor (ECF subfamily)
MHEHVAPLARRLVTADQERDREFESRLQETSTLAFRVAFSVLRHTQDAEDVAQEAFTKAYRRFWQLRDRERFRAWLVRTTWRTALDRQRANRRRDAREAAVGAPGPTTAGEAFRRSGRVQDRAAELWAAIDRLPEKLREAIVLANIEGHDVRQVATLLGVPEGTVKSRLFLARRRLKEALA